MSANKLFSVKNIPKVLYKNRYCNQEGFRILVCGGRNRNGKLTNQVSQIKVPGFEVAEFPSMVKPHYRLQLTCVRIYMQLWIVRKCMKMFVSL